MIRFILCVVIVGIASGVKAEIPNPVGHVNDFAQIINDADEAALEHELEQLKLDTTVEIAVVTVQSLDGMSVKRYTNTLARQWEVGAQGKDNGIVLLVALNEGEIRFEVAEGIRNTIPDYKAQRIIDRTITPLLKEGRRNREKMSEGMVKGTREAIDLVRNPPVEVESSDYQSSGTLAQPRDTSGDIIVLKGFLYVIGGLVLIGLILLGVHKYTLNRDVRKGIKRLQDELPTLIRTVRDSLRHPDVRREQRSAFAELEKKFCEYEWDDSTTLTNREAIILHVELRKIEVGLHKLEKEITNAVEFAEEARDECPALLDSIQPLIVSIEASLNDERVNPKYEGELAVIKAAFATISGHPLPEVQADWVPLFQEVSEISTNLTVLSSAIAKDIGMCENARQRSAMLLRELRNEVSDLETSSRVREEKVRDARSKLDEASRMATSSRVPLWQWLIIHDLLTSGKKSAEAAPLPKPRPASSRSYSSGGGGGGGFKFGGGGGFKGGGASGKF